MTLDALVRWLGDRAGLFAIDILDACPSTNALLLERAQGGAPNGSVVVARHQSAGRGRHGRVWVSSPGDSLTFSLLWRLPAGCALSGLSLAVGVALVRALQRAVEGVDGLQLKWPNDVLLVGGKLAGVLIESVPAAGDQAVVIGVGINLALPAELPADVRATAAALPTGADGERVLALALDELGTACHAFSAAGFSPFHAAWSALDAMRDQPAQLLAAGRPPQYGIARGVDADGALRFESGGAIARVMSGEISLRAQSAVDR